MQKFMKIIHKFGFFFMWGCQGIFKIKLFIYDVFYEQSHRPPPAHLEVVSVAQSWSININKIWGYSNNESNEIKIDHSPMCCVVARVLKNH